MGKSTLVTKTNGHASLAEHGQRLRMVEIRDRIYESDILDLSIAMAQTGRDLVINPDTNEIEDIGPLDQKTRSDYIKLLTHKLISNAAVPKEIQAQPTSTIERWTEYLEAEEQK